MYKCKLLLLILIIFVLSGCQGQLIGGTIEELLVAPQQNGVQKEIFERLKQEAGDKVTFVHPRSGGYLAPILFEDFSKDGKSEAVALYSINQSSTSIKVALLVETEQGYSIADTVDGIGTTVDKIRLAKLLNSDNKQLVIAYANSSLTEKYLVVYDIYDNKLNKILEQEYKNFDIGDVTGDGIEDIVYTSPSSKQGPMEITLLSGGENGLVSRFSGTIDTRLQSSDAINISGKSEKFISLDGTLGIDLFCSELLRFQNDTLFSMGLDNRTNIITKTTRENQYIKTIDIDNDEIFETPVVLDRIAGLPYDKSYAMLGFYDFSRDTQFHKYFGIADLKYNYFITLPQHWYGSIKFEKGDIEGENIITDLEGEPLLVSKLLRKGDSYSVAEIGQFVQVAVVGDSHLLLKLSKNENEYTAKKIYSGVVSLE